MSDTTTATSTYAARPDLADRELLPERIGRYIPVRRLGRGGMGAVYEAVDPSLGRRVAVKVLHRARPGEAEAVRARRRRLLREAQAMARLSHPNVLPVYDVGESGGELFLAMELIAGRSLGEWLSAEQHSWRAIVAVFAAAGRGLAAAHAAGVVHRDFKPGNVLVGDDGKVRVVDFGLARSAGERGDTATRREVPGEGPTARADRVDAPEPLTTAGAVLGTPAYMSPEQRSGGAADARSDQFSFCISLWQALGGEADRDGGGVPRGPRRLRRALFRGLRPDRRERHPSMEPLLVELEWLLRRRRRWLSAAALAAVVVVTGTGLFAAAHDRPAVCRGAERRLAGVWSEGARAALRREFAGTGHAVAAASAGRVISRLDGYGRSWVEMRTEACEATHVHGEQSEALLDLRMQCLDRRLSRMGALVAVLSEQPSSETVAGAIDAAWRLEPLEGCADRDALAQPVPLPPEPERRARVEQLRARLDRASALLHAGRYAAGRELSGFVVGAAERVAYVPLRAEALLLHGELLDRSGDAAEAEQALRAAAAAAAEAGDDERLASAWASLVYVLGMLEARHQEALQLAEVAETIAARARSARISGMLANHQGAVLHAIGRYPEAETSFRRAISLRESALGKEHPDVASSLGNLGSALASQGKLDDAQQLQERALALRVVAFGHEHPIVAGSLTSLARLASLRGDEAEAARREQRALAIRERTLGARHTDAGVSLSNLGGYAAAQGDHTAAVAYYRRAVIVFGAALPPDHPYTSRALTGLGESLVHIGRPAEALPLLETALAIKQKLEDPVELAHAEFALATAVHAAHRDLRRARDLMLRARDNYARAGPRAAEWHRMSVDWLTAHR